MLPGVSCSKGDIPRVFFKNLLPKASLKSGIPRVKSFRPRVTHRCHAKTSLTLSKSVVQEMIANPKPINIGSLAKGVSMRVERNVFGSSLKALLVGGSFMMMGPVHLVIAGHIWELTPSRALFWISTPLLGAGVAFGSFVNSSKSGLQLCSSWGVFGLV